MKKILISLAAFLSATLFLILTNMGEVLLLFKVWRLDLVPALLCAIVLTGLAGMMAGYLLTLLVKGRERNHALAVMIYQSVMTTGNIIMNQSLEPIWYKVVYILVTGVSVFFSIHYLTSKRNQS